MNSPLADLDNLGINAITTHSTEIALALLVWNATVFMVYGFDKIKAENGTWRTPERTLLTYAFWGASPGALLACQLFRHKLRKARFFDRLMRIAIVQVVLAGLFIGLIV